MANYTALFYLITSRIFTRFLLLIPVSRFSYYNHIVIWGSPLPRHPQESTSSWQTPHHYRHKGQKIYIFVNLTIPKYHFP